ESLMEKNWPSLRVLCRMLRIDYTMAMQKASNVRNLMQLTLNPRRTALPLKVSLSVPDASRTSRSAKELIPGSLEDSGLESDDDTGLSMRNQNNFAFNNNYSFPESITSQMRTFPKDNPNIELDPPKPERMLSLLKKQPKKKSASNNSDSNQNLSKRIPRASRDCVP
ncbi:hypothetical protein FO519_010900, partial [Halicephalobus sp. NKZ332]